jgi:hypothetical protein
MKICDDIYMIQSHVKTATHFKMILRSFFFIEFYRKVFNSHNKICFKHAINMGLRIPDMFCFLRTTSTMTGS